MRSQIRALLFATFCPASQHSRTFVLAATLQALDLRPQIRALLIAALCRHRVTPRSPFTVFRTFIIVLPSASTSPTTTPVTYACPSESAFVRYAKRNARPRTAFVWGPQTPNKTSIVDVRPFLLRSLMLPATGAHAQRTGLRSLCISLLIFPLVSHGWPSARVFNAGGRETLESATTLKKLTR